MANEPQDHESDNGEGAAGSLRTTINLPEGLGTIAKRAARRQVRTLNGYIASLIAKDAVGAGLMTEEEVENLKPSTR